MLVGVWQFDVAKGDTRANRAAAGRGLEAAARAGVELLLLPEMWPTSFLSSFGEADPLAVLAPAIEGSVEAVGAIGARAAELGLAVAGSAYAPGPPGALPYNRLSLWSGGHEVLRYDKTHLFTVTAEHLAFSAGDAPPGAVALEARDGERIGVAGCVCYDLRFAPVGEAARASGAELLLVPAQWPSARSAHFESLLAGRAVELQASVLGANRIGVENLGRRRPPLRFPGNSRLLGPDGTLRSEPAQGVEGLVVGEVRAAEVRDLRAQVRVTEDRREALYARWRDGHNPLQ